MEIIDILKLADGSIAVGSVLFVGWMIRGTLQTVLSNQQDIIRQLIELCADDEKPH